jgi:hypothetical protein
MSSDPQNAAVIAITLKGTVKNILAPGPSTPAERCTAADFSVLYGGGAQASYGGTGKGDGNFSVLSAGYLDFVFFDTSIRPIGICFKFDGDSSIGLGPRGDINMPFNQMSFLDYGYHSGPGGADGASIRVYDTFANKGKPGQQTGDGNAKVRWGYYIFFQDSLGTIGMIDPDVENDTEN